jgi:hypothetical protein
MHFRVLIAHAQKGAVKVNGTWVYASFFDELMALPAFGELSSTERNELVLSTLAWINGVLTQLEHISACTYALVCTCSSLATQSQNRCPRSSTRVSIIALPEEHR